MYQLYTCKQPNRFARFVEVLPKACAPFVNQILIWILLVASIVSAAVQSWPEFGLILLVVLINVLLGVLQEGKASKATAALKSLLSSKATVIRDGNRLEIETIWSYTTPAS